MFILRKKNKTINFFIVVFQVLLVKEDYKCRPDLVQY